MLEYHVEAIAAEIFVLMASNIVSGTATVHGNHPPRMCCPAASRVGSVDDIQLGPLHRLQAYDEHAELCRELKRTTTSCQDDGSLRWTATLNC